VAEHLPDDDPFADVWAGNAAYAETFHHAELTGVAAKHLTVVTCMDTRIDPLAVLGLAPGDAKIIRSAGARVTETTIRSLVLAVHLLGGTRILVMPHTECGVVGTDDGVREKLAAAAGLDPASPEVASFRPMTIPSPTGGLAEDVARIRAHPLLGPDLDVAAAVYDVRTGRLDPVPV
jgi:carbonic anhydrase